MNLKKNSSWWSSTKNTNLGTVIYILAGFAFAWFAMTGLGLIFHTDTPVVAVFSQSMVPTFYKGDMIIVEGSKNYSVGDIIVFDAVTGGYKFPIIHRVIKINDDGTLETKGDANPVQGEFEHKIPKTSVHGKDIFKIPLLGWVKVGAFELLGLA